VELIEERVRALSKATPEEKTAILSELKQLCMGENGDTAIDKIERTARSQILTVQWDLEELIELVRPPAPPPAEEPEEESEDEDEDSDMRMVYNDPRGLVLHCNQDGSRWLATQMDPRTRMPQTFELQQEEISRIKMQLAGSPHWTADAPK